MKVFIAAVMILLSFSGAVDAANHYHYGSNTAAVMGSDDFFTVNRYYGTNGRMIVSERVYPERSMFYDGHSGLYMGQKATSNHATQKMHGRR